MRCLTELTPTRVLGSKTDIFGVAPHLQRYLLTFHHYRSKITTSSLAQPKTLTGSYSWPSDRQPEKLLAILPLLGSFRYNRIVEEGCIGAIRHANDDICVLGMAYIYRAAKHAGLLDGEWADMEALIRSQDMHGKYVRVANTLEVSSSRPKASPFPYVSLSLSLLRRQAQRQAR